MSPNSPVPRPRNAWSPAVWILFALVLGGVMWSIIYQLWSANSGPRASPPPAPNRSEPPTPTTLRSGDDPAYDWEAPGHPQARNAGDWTYAIKPNFASSRTLEQTTTWLKWAIETYAHVKEPADLTYVDDVKFSGCKMRWDEKRYLQEGIQVNETIYTLNLADVDIAYGAVQADGQSVKFVDDTGLSNPKFEKLEKFWEKDGWTMRSKGERTTRDSSAIIQLQEKDDISRRIGWALVHAVNLCGGKASR